MLWLLFWVGQRQKQKQLVCKVLYIVPFQGSPRALVLAPTTLLHCQFILYYDHTPKLPTTGICVLPLHYVFPPVLSEFHFSIALLKFLGFPSSTSTVSQVSHMVQPPLFLLVFIR